MKAGARKITAALLEALREADAEAAERVQAALVAPDARKTEQPEALLLTQAQSARALGCSRWTVRNLTRNGQLVPVPLLGAKRYRRGDVEKLAGIV